ncbi:MAG: hypothetical protein KC466_06565, partial [Myxococcales bacterium]|nr:hypothetical protein [Myxococcales bacterium]
MKRIAAWGLGGAFILFAVPVHATVGDAVGDLVGSILQVPCSYDRAEQRILHAVELPTSVTPCTTLVSLNDFNQKINATTIAFDLSRDGRVFIFNTAATNVLTGFNPGGRNHVFVRDLTTGDVELVTQDIFGNQASTGGAEPAISGDGRLAGFKTQSLILDEPLGIYNDAYVRDLSTGTVARGSFLTDGSRAGASDIAFNADGRYLVYNSGSNGGHVYVHDLMTLTTIRASVQTGGGAANFGSGDPQISGDGRHVVFESSATDLVGGDGNGQRDIFAHDRDPDGNGIFDEGNGVTTLLSRGPFGVLGNDASYRPAISDDGRYVAFITAATNLDGSDADDRADVYVKDRQTGALALVSVSSAEQKGTLDCEFAQIAGGGRYVVFQTSASNAVANDTNGNPDAFVRDLQANTTERVSLTAVDGQASGLTSNPTISDDGRYVAFDHNSLLAGGVIGTYNVYVRDRTAGTTTLVNVTSDETLPDAGAASPTISGNGRYVVFTSSATNLVPGDTNPSVDAFLRDLVAGTTERVSLPDGPGEMEAGGASVRLGVDDDASHILFQTIGKATAGSDAGNDPDIFLRVRSSGRTSRITTSSLVPDPAANTFFAAIDDTGSSVAFRITPKMTSDAAFDQAYVVGGVTTGVFPSLDQQTDQLYVDFLGRSATSAEKAAWSTKVTTGAADTATLAAQLAADPAYTASRAPLIRLYWAFFLR